MAATELGEYLRTLRDAVTPTDVGLPTTDRRRVPGLRRDELARLVGLSSEYYMRLEQGRAGHPSDSVLNAIARSLRLTPAQSSHLMDLARTPNDLLITDHVQLRDGLDTVVGAIRDIPAVLMNRGLDVLGFNELACQVIADFATMRETERNMARHVFLDPQAQRVHVDWDSTARETVGMLRMATHRPPLEESLVSLIAELRTKSPAFEALWSTHYVCEKTHGDKVFRNAEVGLIETRFETFLVSGQENHMLVIYTVDRRSESFERLTALRAASRSTQDAIRAHSMAVRG